MDLCNTLDKHINYIHQYNVLLIFMIDVYGKGYYMFCPFKSGSYSDYLKIVHII